MAEEWKEVAIELPIKTLIPVLKTLDSVLTGVTNLVNALSKILNLLQLFISAFNSFSALLGSIIKYVNSQVQKLSGQLGSAGIFVNILVPPAFMNILSKNFNWTRLTTGGFDGFLQRLKVSLYNSSDVNRPQFDKDGLVGGFLIIADTENLDDFFRAIEFLQGMFQFMDLFPINTKPQPPVNLRATPQYFQQPDKTVKFGIKVEWDAPPVLGFTQYRLSRSKTFSGTIETKEIVPTRLIGPPGHPEDGLLVAIKEKLFGPTKSWPIKQVVTYSDAGFNGGKPKEINPLPITMNGVYIDYEVFSNQSKTYFYTLQSGFTPDMWGAYSAVLSVNAIPEKCLSPNAVGAVTHKGGRIELMSVGVGSLGQWSSIQITAVIPFIPELVTLISNFLTSLQGNLKTNTKSFMEFINGIIDKFTMYKNMVEAIATAVIAIENFFSGIPKMAVLNVPPAKGGIDNFISRVMNATKPDTGFSGTGGTTLGVAFVYGASLNNPLSGLGGGDASMDEQAKALKAAFGLIGKLLG